MGMCVVGIGILGLSILYIVFHGLPTAEFLKKEKIPYEEKDVEKDKQAQQELACKALKTGTRVNGVPVLDIGGTLLLGFDRDDILRLAKKLKKPVQ